MFCSLLVYAEQLAKNTSYCRFKFKKYATDDMSSFKITAGDSWWIYDTWS